jgi:uncharacterized protein
MRLENTCVVQLPRQKLWDYLIVIPKVAECLPGVEEVTAVDAENYEGVIQVKVGIVKLRLRGKIHVEFIDNDRYVASLAVQAADQKISGLVQGKMQLRLDAISERETKLNVETDLNLLGKIGEFGHGLIKKKGDQMMAQFEQNLVAKVGAAA